MPATILSVSQAIAGLRHSYPVTKPIEAIEFLQQTLNSIQILNLYQHFFPTEFTTSTSSIYSDSPDIHSPRELEFFSRLDETELIPISPWQLEIAQEERLDELLIEPWGLDWLSYEDYDIESLAPEWQILLPLTSKGLDWLTENDAQDWYEEEFNVLFSHVLPPDSINYLQFQELCSLADFPIKSVPIVLSFLSYSTGNIWLDGCTQDEYQFREWTVENLISLSAQWQSAKEVITQAQQVIDWLATDRPRRFQQILELWNKSTLSI
ncbi:hypothetical protein QUA54_05310 [Microcoleus sp. MOSTC5]|uniref:hypothetical protein n=1 Tax=Microcoleus sp. MOSTC5 TaxID=3055378 RepID=UPI002FD01820